MRPDSQIVINIAAFPLKIWCVYYNSTFPFSLFERNDDGLRAGNAAILTCGKEPARTIQVAHAHTELPVEIIQRVDARRSEFK